MLRAKSSSRPDGGAGLAQEGRQDLERLGQRVVARGERRERGLAVGDQAAQLAVLSRDRVERPAGVAHDAAQRHLLLVQRAQQVGAALEEGRGVAERVVQVRGEPAGRRDPGVVQPLLEVAARARVEGPEHLVQLDRVLDVGPPQRPAVGECCGSGWPGESST